MATIRPLYEAAQQSCTGCVFQDGATLELLGGSSLGCDDRGDKIPYCSSADRPDRQSMVFTSKPHGDPVAMIVDRSEDG